MNERHEMTNMQPIKPTIRRQQVNQTQNEMMIPLDQDSLEDMFQSFVKFVDSSSPNTVRTYATSLKQWFKYLREKGIKQPQYDTVFDYKQTLKQQGKKATTIQNYVMAVKQFFKWTEAEELYPDIARNVKGAKLSRQFKKDYLKPSQAKKVLSVIDRSTIEGKRNYCMLAVMLTMGLRTIEIVRANVENIRNVGEDTVLYVYGKGHLSADDPVRMPDHVEAALQEYLNARKVHNASEPLFTSTSNRNKNGRMTTRAIRGIVKKIFRKAGLDSPRLTAHSTRHTAATLSLMNGASVREVQQLLRHKNIQTTEIYAHDLNAAKNQASQDVDNVLFN